MDGSNVITRKNFFMKSSNQLEVILFSQYSLKDIRQRELVRWLGTAAQSEIGRQLQRTKKVFLKTLKDTPAIFMS